MHNADDVLELLAADVGRALADRGFMLALAESCTGGWIAQVVTSVPGSSGWFERGYVTYSNAAKQDLLGVSADTLATHGAVSEWTAREMAAGAIAGSRAQVAIAVTGIAGPDGGTDAKPVGMVWFAWARPGAAMHVRCQRFSGDRQAVRRQSVEFALRELLSLLIT